MGILKPQPVQAVQGAMKHACCLQEIALKAWQLPAHCKLDVMAVLPWMASSCMLEIVGHGARAHNLCTQRPILESRLLMDACPQG